MSTVGAFEAETHLAALLDKVEAGKDIASAKAAAMALMALRQSILARNQAPFTAAALDECRLEGRR